MRQSLFCHMSERSAEAASQARQMTNYHVTMRTKALSNHKLSYYILPPNSTTRRIMLATSQLLSFPSCSSHVRKAGM